MDSGILIDREGEGLKDILRHKGRGRPGNRIRDRDRETKISKIKDNEREKERKLSTDRRSG